MISYLLTTDARLWNSYSYSSSANYKYSSSVDTPNGDSRTYESEGHYFYTYLRNAEGGESEKSSGYDSGSYSHTRFETAYRVASKPSLGIGTRTYSASSRWGGSGARYFTLDANGYATQADEQNSGTTGASGWTKGYMDGTKRITYTGSFGSIVTYVSKQSTTTVGTHSTFTKSLYQSVGTSEGDYPALTTQSWAEIFDTYTTTSVTCSIYESTSTIVNPNRKLSHYTVFEIGIGETLCTLKGVAGDTFVDGDGANTVWESYAGPQTITISNVPRRSIQFEKVNVSVPSPPYHYNYDSEILGVDQYGESPNAYVASSTTTLYYKTTDGPFQTLTSSSLEANAAEFTQKDTTGFGPFDLPPLMDLGWPTTSKKVKGRLFNTLVVSNGTFFEQEYGSTTHWSVLPFCRSEDIYMVSDESIDGVSTTKRDRRSEWAEEGNYYVYLIATHWGDVWGQNGGGASHWALAYNNCWGVVGDGTSATAVPKISWEANGTSIKSWDVALISKGVQTPYPAYGTEGIGTRTITDAVPTTTDYSQTKTTGIWGKEYRETTSSTDSSSMTISTVTFPLAAGGNPYSCITEVGDDWTFWARGRANAENLLPEYLPRPEGVFVVGGGAYIEGEKLSALVAAGEYYHTTLASAMTFDGETLAKTTYQMKRGREIIEFYIPIAGSVNNVPQPPDLQFHRHWKMVLANSEIEAHGGYL